MAETENKVEALEKEAVAEASANPQADAPKKNAVAAEPSHIASMNNAEDLGAAVVKPTDSNPDATKKTKQVSGDAQQKNQGAADPMPKLKEQEETKEGSEEIKEGEMPKAALDALKKHKEKKEDKEDKSEKTEASHEDEKMKKKEGYGMKSASYKMKKEEVDEHMNAMVTGQDDLSEEFKTKAATVFESAVNSKVKEIAETMDADYNNKLEQESAKAKEELTEKVDSYLSYVVEEWMKENEIALERGIKGEIAEDFISGLKKLFSEHYIDVPDEKYDVLEAQATKIEDLEKKLNEQIEKNVELNKDNADKTRNEVMAEVANDLADTQKEKVSSLAEGVEFENEEQYKAKLEMLKESYFPQKEVAQSEDDVIETTSTSEELNEEIENVQTSSRDAQMQAYLDMLGKK